MHSLAIIRGLSRPPARCATWAAKRRWRCPRCFALYDTSDPLAPSAADALVHIDAERGNEFAQSLVSRGEFGSQALAIFGELGPVAWQAAPLLRRRLADPNTRKPERIVWAPLRMSDFGNDVLAAIVRNAKDARFGVRWESAMQLEYIGPRAHPLRAAIEQRPMPRRQLRAGPG
jgi:hypothetical protein